MAFCGKCGKTQHCSHAELKIVKKANSLTLVPQNPLALEKDFFKTSSERGSTFRVRFMSEGSGLGIAVKWVKESHRCGYEHFQYYKKAAGKTEAILSSFKRRINTNGWKIHVVKPLLVNGPKHSVVVAEPYIYGNLKNFSSNTFWEVEPSRTYEKLVLALCHFSYIHSDGQYVLANLKGFVNEEERCIVLLAPSLVSKKVGRYGCGDLGIIDQFSKNHTCNSICRGLPTHQTCKHWC